MLAESPGTTLPLGRTFPVSRASWAIVAGPARYPRVESAEGGADRRPFLRCSSLRRDLYSARDYSTRDLPLASIVLATASIDGQDFLRSSRMKAPFGRTALILLLAATIIGLTMFSGMRRGLHHVMPVSSGDQTAVAIALSRLVHQIKFGYLGLKPVEDKLYQHWNRDSQGWGDLARLKPNFRNVELLNAGIREASSLELGTPGFVSDGTLIVMNGIDIGQVDYVTLAFGLFGSSVQSLFYFYFAIVGLSAFVFILTFRNNGCALAVLLCTLTAYYMEQQLAVFDQAAMPTYYGMMHGSTMCLIAMWHFAFLLLSRQPPNAWVVAGSLVQLAILILAWRIRGTTAWIFVYLLCVTFALAAGHFGWRRIKSLLSRFLGLESGRALSRSVVVLGRSTLQFAEEALRWPVVLLLLGLGGSWLYDRVTLHPVYFSGDVMPKRSIWADAYQGLAAYDPRVLQSRVGTAMNLPDGGGSHAWWGARDNMDRLRISPWDGRVDIARPAPGLRSEWTGIGARTRMLDRMARGAFIDAVKSHPRRVLAVYFIKKPLHIGSSLARSFWDGKIVRWLLLTVLVGCASGALAIWCGARGDCTARDVLWLSGAALLASTTPSLWSLAGPANMADSSILLAAFVPIMIGMGTKIALARSVVRPGNRRAVADALGRVWRRQARVSVPADARSADRGRFSTPE